MSLQQGKEFILLLELSLFEHYTEYWNITLLV